MFDVGYWATAEVCLGVVCACLPLMRPVLSRVRIERLFAFGRPTKSRPPSQQLGNEIPPKASHKGIFHYHDDSLLGNRSSFASTELSDKDAEAAISLPAPAASDSGAISAASISPAVESLNSVAYPRRPSRIWLT